MRSGPCLHDSRGVTLAELVVALGLSAVLTLGVVGLWQKTQEAFFVGADVAEVQENIRAALDFMHRELRATGRDLTACAFDYSGPLSLDCTAAKVALCRLRLGADYAPSGCGSIFAIPYAEATATTLRIRADRNDSGTIAGTASASVGDSAEENVRYALATGSPPCPPGVPACITRNDGTGSAPMVAVEVSGLQFTYYPRPGFPPCAGTPSPSPCPAFALPFTSQEQADNVGRIRIAVTARTVLAGQPVSRTFETDVVLRNRN